MLPSSQFKAHNETHLTYGLSNQQVSPLSGGKTNQKVQERIIISLESEKTLQGPEGHFPQSSALSMGKAFCGSLPAFLCLVGYEPLASRMGTGIRWIKHLTNPLRNAF